MFRALRRWWKERSYRHLKNQTVEAIFTGIYEKNEWGGPKGTFYSGEGTYLSDNQKYVDKVREFIRDQQILSILEIGCGDFHVAGQVLHGLDVKYTGGDVVGSLIQHHQQKYQTDKVRFMVLNAIDDALPTADLVIIRQVLQHLNNEQILKILSKVKAFKWALITEHLPADANAIPNQDKITGSHVRVNDNSGVYMDHPPFQIGETTVFLEYPLPVKIKGKMVGSVIRTYLVASTISATTGTTAGA